MELWNGSSMLYRSGPYNGIRFSATPIKKHIPLCSFDFVYKTDEYYSDYKPKDHPFLSRIVINQTANALQCYTFSEGDQRWKLNLHVPRDECDYYNRCSSFGICSMIGMSSMCKCLTGFIPKSPLSWSLKDWCQGCVRSDNWSCREKNKDGFIKFQNVKLPDTKQSWINRSMTLEKCKEKCWENCSCTAYANSNIIGDGSGCILWFGDLLDLRQLPDSGQDLYVRSVASENDMRTRKTHDNHPPPRHYIEGKVENNPHDVVTIMSALEYINDTLSTIPSVESLGESAHPKQPPLTHDPPVIRSDRESPFCIIFLKQLVLPNRSKQRHGNNHFSIVWLEQFIHLIQIPTPHALHHQILQTEPIHRLILW
ncbi:hypothetical protein TSUD_372410 [Trifolium subterraneum]|uniref:non-specific serine/threonine protein kinase n=1 Tax=Trifolium subterraneum TaxID=3900 RepID=A0A2Z6MFP6_TRISU|nr:hypothetical protein TSUD_372410 [Trifolium subterraneum]